MTATQQRPDWWRDEFRSLDGLPLLPCGAGESKKAPFPDNWPNLSFSLDEVMAYSGVRCIGMRCGPDAGGILVVDYDGLSAIQFAAENFPSDPSEPDSWIIGRENNPNRYKEAFYVPQDRWDRCVGKTVLRTDEDKREQLEFFFSSGQVIVAGQHVSSGGEYRWLNGSPDEIRPVPDSIWEMYQESIVRGGTAPGVFVARRSREENNGWRDNVPCEICGRTDPDCRISNDGDAILCHKGNRWSPPVLAVGETIERLSGVWAYVGDRANQHGPGMGALFRREDPQRQLRKKRTVQAGEALALMQKELGDQPMLNVRSRGIHCHGREFSADEVENLYLHLSRGQHNWPKRLTADTFTTLAADAPFDPVQVYLGNLSSDLLPSEQWERLDQWLFGIDDPITARFMQRFLVACVQRVFEPGCQQRQMPVLLGPQGIGKTVLGRAVFSDEWYGDGISSAMDVDDITLLALCWGCEFAEFDGFTRKASAEKLKAFISRTTDLCRRKYGKGTERIPRRSVFWGTANRSPLVDRTGSTRFCLIPLPGEKLPFERVALGRDELWARALAEYRNGFQSFSTDAELDEIVGRNSGYDLPDPWAELIGGFLGRRAGTPYVELQEIYRFLEIGAERQTGHNAKRITELAEEVGWVKSRRRIGKDRVNAFFPDRATPTPPDEADVRFLGADGVSRPF